MNAPHGNAFPFCAALRLAEPQLPGLTNPGAISYFHVEGTFAPACSATTDDYLTYTVPHENAVHVETGARARTGRTGRAERAAGVRAFLRALAVRFADGGAPARGEIALRIHEVLDVWNALHGRRDNPNQFAARIKDAALGGELSAPGGAILEHRKRNGRMVWLLRPALLGASAATRRGLARKTKRELLGIVRELVGEGAV